MEITAKDDLRNRIPPRLHDFHSQYVNDQSVGYGEGVVSWYTSNYQKDYCQSQFGYTCQRPAASIYGSDGTGNLKLSLSVYLINIRIKNMLI